ncbi:E3 ubiquitin-protein ligase RFWD3-like, partial [Copidosoma floridanum]|uniref:E3 ubiquitin-protein ligase RFWD3-like n=1 Tax=Copidosoma floridanum TaxID=29053 RepID=UPI0006C9C60C
MTSPFDYSVSSFVVSNINDTEDSEIDFGDENNSNIQEESEISFPTDVDNNTNESDFDSPEADLVDLDDFSFLYDNSEGNTESEDLVQVESDSDDEDFIEEESVKLDNDNKQSDDEVVDFYHKCPICLSAWTNVGSHRLCSLRCGHLFGYSCIKHWLNSSNESAKKCPQCNARASQKHIRYIYANKLTSIDNSELESIKKQIDETKLKISKVTRALRKEKRRAKKYKRL